MEVGWYYLIRMTLAFVTEVFSRLNRGETLCMQNLSSGGRILARVQWLREVVKRGGAPQFIYVRAPSPQDTLY
jgi:hypothetical protein